MRWAAVTSVAAMAVSGLAGSASAATHAHEGPPPPARVVPVRAVVSGGIERLPLVGARVVLRHDGRRVGQGRTGRQGLALIHLAHVPRRLDARVSGGRVAGHALSGALRARVAGYRAPAELCVTPVTTLVASQRGPLSRVRKQVRALLKLSANDDLQCDDARSDAWFDGRAFLADAARHGGVARYLAQLERRLGRAHVAQATATSGNWASTAATAAEGVSSGLQGLLKTGAFSSLTWLKAAAGWSTVALGTFDVLDAFFGGQSGPTNADVISDLDQDFTALDDAVGELQDAVSLVQASVTQVEATALGTAQAQIVADAASTANQVTTVANYLNSISSAAVQITCGSANQCPSNPPSVSQTCPASTLLTWNDETGQVVYPAGWTGTGTTTLENDCISYSELVYGEGGFVSQVQTYGLSWASLGTLNSWVNGTGSVPGIVQYTSMGTMVQVRFLDNPSSLVTESMFDSYLALYQQLMTELMVYASATGEPAVDQQTGLTAQPTVGQFEAAAPTTVPPGTVVDATTGLVWSQAIGANIQCGYLLGQPNISGSCATAGTVSPGAAGSVGFTNAPATLTPQSISGPGLQTIAATSGGAPTLNVGSGAVTPIDPISITSPTATGTPLGDWYAASPEQTATLFANATPAAGQTGGDWLQQPAGQNGGAGFSAAVFGAGVSIPVNTLTFQRLDTNGFCITADGCYTEPIASPATSCTLAGNTGCASPSLNPASVSDLNNGGTGALQTASSAANWSTSFSGCTDVDALTGQCRSGDTATYPSAFGGLDANGWVTWFVRNPPPTPSGQTSECYFYAPPDYNPTPGVYATPGTTQGSAACQPPAFPGNNGLLSQTLSPGS
jgi:hypothetical protein